MNLLTSIFLERFDSKRYYNSMGRSYVEYMCGKESGYRGEICFFHFSNSGQRKNGYMNIEILSFIKAYYSHAFDTLYPLVKLAILFDVVVTFNSFTEYSFLIKFQGHNLSLNHAVEKFLKLHTGVDIKIPTQNDNKFYEIFIDIFPQVSIKKFRIYFEEEKGVSDDVQEYTDISNIFMTLKIQEIIFETKNTLYNKGVLYKFTAPILFSKSEFLKKNFGDMLSPYFSLDSIYLAFVEKMETSKNDILYFTDGFSIPA